MSAHRSSLSVVVKVGSMVPIGRLMSPISLFLCDRIIACPLSAPFFISILMADTSKWCSL